MAIKVKFDNNYNAIEPTFVLATRGGKKLGILQAYNVHVSDSVNAYDELLFCVNKYNDGGLTPLWNQIQDFKLVYCPEMDTWFEIYVEIADSNEVIKNVSCVSLGEAELSQVNLYGVEINTEADISRTNYKPTILFNETDKEASLLNRIMEKAPHYTIRHVDASIARIQRTFAFDNISLYDAFQEISAEIDCIFIIGSGSNEDGSIARSVSVYDLESYCIDCGKRGDFLYTCSECGSSNISPGYGEDTCIFICADNLANGITYSTNTDAVKNCFRLEGGDDLMTATIANCNPNGSNYLWYLSDVVREDMSDDLKARLNTYDALYESYQNTRPISLNSSVLSRYNALVDKYSAYKSGLAKIPTSIIGYPALMNAYYDTIDLQLLLHDELMPSQESSDTTASAQVALLNSTSLSPVAVNSLNTCSAATATNAVLAMAKILVDKRYRVKVDNGTLNGTLWSGSFTVTSYSDEEDTANSATIRVTITDNYSEFVQQKMSKALSDSIEDSLSSVSALFDMSLGNFKVAIRKYCLVSLQSFANACLTCLDIMIEQGVANNETWANQSPNLYSTLYLPYYQKYTALQEEIILRESEIATITGTYDTDGKLQEDGIQTLIQRENDEIHAALHFENYLGENLWREFVAYRREDTYKNDNYISDGLTNSELFSLALEFIEKAKEEIFKSATLQHSISSTLKNLLVMDEFKPIVDYFQVGNWIRVSVDGEVYRLRLLSYELAYGDLDSISVVFSDVTKVADGITDTQSLLNQAASMASSYGGVTRQAEQASKSKVTLDSWVTEGLALTKMKIIDSAKDQNVTFDEHGVLCRQYLPITGAYDDKQLKIINRGLYLTDDGWLTSRAGIGDFVFYNPETGDMEEAYGVIADTLVGNLILSQKVGIYNMDNSIVLDQNGIVITTNGVNVPGDQKVFTIRRKDYDENGVELLQNLFFVDNSGNLTYTGTLKGADGDFTGSVTATSLIIRDGDADKPVDEYVGDRIDPVRDSLEDLIDTVDGETVIYYQTTAPTNVNNKDIWYNTSNNVIQRYIDGEWIDITDTTLGLSLQAISNAQATADGKIITFAQSSPPTAAAVGDLWIDTDDNNKLYRWNGTAWIPYRDDHLDYLVDVVDGKTTTFYSATEPTEAVENDIWYDTDDHKIMRKTATGWEDITSEALYDALTAAGNAQATADGKIVTFAQASAPTAVAVGDLWVDTDDKNKLYRWDGTKWVECRDKTIADAQAAADNAREEAITAQNQAGAAQKSADAAQSTADAASSSATAARTYANSIYNGTTGIFFTSSSVAELAMNTSVGLKITGSDGTYFQVKNDAMGFFRKDGTAMLYYENGSVTLSGIIAAHGGYIGGPGGWVIGTNCIYNGGASSIGTAGGIYLGTAGISVGSAISMQPDGTFIIRGDNTTRDDTNYVLKIVPEQTSDGDTIYRLCLGNITFDGSFVLPPENGGTGGTGRDDVGSSIGIYRVTSITAMSNLTNSVNGDLCILNSEGAEGVYVSGTYTTSTTTAPGYLAIGAYSATGHRYTNYFDISGIAYWNVANLSGESVSSSYARVGVGYTVSGACGLFVPLKINASSSITSVTINFNFATRPANCNRDLCPSWKNGIHVSLYKGNSSVKVATTTYTMPSSWRTASSTLRSASVTLNSSSGITSGEYYVAFYTNSTYSLMWIQPASISIEGKSIGAVDGLYLRSGNMWKSIASSANYGVTYILPAASATALGGVKIGNNIAAASDGTISVALTSTSAFGVVKIGNNINVSNGVISLSKANIISALGYDPASGGSSVSISNRLTSGVRIATITIDNTLYDLYAPTSDSSGTISGDYVSKTGDTMTGTLTVQGTYYPCIKFNPTYASNYFGVVEGSYVGSAALSIYEDANGNTRRMIEVRSTNCSSSLDDAVVLRTADNGSYMSYNIFHSGMTNAGKKAARISLGIFYSDSLPTTGIDGQICLVPV